MRISIIGKMLRKKVLRVKESNRKKVHSCKSFPKRFRISKSFLTYARCLGFPMSELGSFFKIIYSHNEIYKASPHDLKLATPIHPLHEQVVCLVRKVRVVTMLKRFFEQSTYRVLFFYFIFSLFLCLLTIDLKRVRPLLRMLLQIS